MVKRTFRRSKRKINRRRSRRLKGGKSSKTSKEIGESVTQKFWDECKTIMDFINNNTKENLITASESLRTILNYFLSSEEARKKLKQDHEAIKLMGKQFFPAPVYNRVFPDETFKKKIQYGSSKKIQHGSSKKIQQGGGDAAGELVYTGPMGGTALVNFFEMLGEQMQMQLPNFGPYEITARSVDFFEGVVEALSTAQEQPFSPQQLAWAFRHQELGGQVSAAFLRAIGQEPTRTREEISSAARDEEEAEKKDREIAACKEEAERLRLELEERDAEIEQLREQMEALLEPGDQDEDDLSWR